MEEESGLARSEFHNGLRNFGQNHKEKYTKADMLLTDWETDDIDASNEESKWPALALR